MNIKWKLIVKVSLLLNALRRFLSWVSSFTLNQWQLLKLSFKNLLLHKKPKYSPKILGKYCDLKKRTPSNNMTGKFHYLNQIRGLQTTKRGKHTAYNNGRIWPPIDRIDIGADSLKTTIQKNFYSLEFSFSLMCFKNINGVCFTICQETI